MFGFEPVKVDALNHASHDDDDDHDEEGHEDHDDHDHARRAEEHDDEHDEEEVGSCVQPPVSLLITACQSCLTGCGPLG